MKDVLEVLKRCLPKNHICTHDFRDENIPSKSYRKAKKYNEDIN